VRADLKTVVREVESLISRIAALESASGIAPGNDVGFADLHSRVDLIERQIGDETTMGPKKLAIKFGARMDKLDERMQALEVGQEMEDDRNV